MLRNISECLKPGGYFIGTTPDAYDIVNRGRTATDAATGRFGNSVYSIALPAEYRDPDAKIPLFGAQYDFHLEGVVDCPEFLVHFPTLGKLAEKFGLMLIAKRRFGNYFQQMKDRDPELLARMNALETFPAFDGVKLTGEATKGNYAHGKEFCRKLREESGRDRYDRIGTLSQEEWEAATLYVIFAFKKMNL